MSTSVTGTSPCAPSSFARRGSRRPVPTWRCSPRSTVIRCSPGRAGSSSPPSIRSSPTTREFTSCSWIRYGRRRVSGHSKWSTIKHKKGAADAKRGKLFSKLSRAILVAAKEGGGDPAANLALQNAIEKARSYSMPKDNIDRAIAKGSGEGADAQSFETIVYEGYGPEGVAVIVEALTDNRNRTAADVRHMFSKHGGNLGATGAVAWQFDRRGVVVVPADGVDEEELLLVAADGGADHIELDGDVFQVTSAPESLSAVREAIEGGGFTVDSAELQLVPKTTVSVDDE